MSCEYSVPYPGVQSAVSANGAIVTAVTAGNRLAVRNCNTLEVTNIFQCVDKIDKVEISPDSTFVLCALYSRNVIQVFSFEDKDWKCRINEGVAGMTNAYWTPDSRNVVVESDFGIQVSIWSLTDSNSVIISLPKPAYSVYSKTSAFSDCGRFYALVHRIDLQDQIGVYSVASQTSLGMSEIAKFRARSNDVASVYWVPGGTHLITLDSPLTYKFCAYTAMGECLATYEAYQNALGIRSIALCKSLPSYVTSSAAACAEGKFIALGSFDGKVRLISTHSWQMAFALPLLHPRELEAGFNSAGLLLTVEVAASTNTARNNLHSTTSGAGGEEEEGEVVDEVEGSAPSVKQHQVPPVKQVMHSAMYVPNRLRGVMLDKEGQAITAISARTGGGDAGAHSARSTRAAEEEAEAREYALLASMDSYFALRHAKTLPRAQAFALDKRNTTLNSTLSTARRPTTTATTASTSSGGSGFPAVGVSWVGWSANSQLLAAREEAHPRCVWVWRPLQAQLVAVLVLLEPVTCARWRPLPTEIVPSLPGLPSAPTAGTTSNISTVLSPTPGTSTSTSGGTATGSSSSTRLLESEETEVLAFCTGTSRVYFWTPTAGVTFSDTSTLSVEEDGTLEAANPTLNPNPSSNPSSNSNQGQSQGFAVTSLLWAKDGRSLILRGKEAHAICRVSLPVCVQQKQH